MHPIARPAGCGAPGPQRWAIFRALVRALARVTGRSAKWLARASQQHKRYVRASYTCCVGIEDAPREQRAVAASQSDASSVGHQGRTLAQPFQAHLATRQINRQASGIYYGMSRGGCGRIALCSTVHEALWPWQCSLLQPR